MMAVLRIAVRMPPASLLAFIELQCLSPLHRRLFSSWQTSWEPHKVTVMCICHASEPYHEESFLIVIQLADLDSSSRLLAMDSADVAECIANKVSPVIASKFQKAKVSLHWNATGTQQLGCD